jgi:hypothetical protein
LPVALISGALKTGSRVPHSFDDEGVTCSVCHSIVEARLEGTGSYTIAPPALLVTKDGRRLREASDAQILANVAGHRRAVMRPLLRTPEFCAACHKSSITPDLSGYDFMQRGFDVYDEWQQSSFSGESASAPEEAAGRATCQDCHMARIPSTDDSGAKQHRIASHRWPGANTAVPLFYKEPEQLQATRSLLQSGIAHTDVFSVENQRSGERVMALHRRGTTTLRFRAGDPLTVQVLVVNDRVGHAFPPELRDLYDARIEFSASDSAGREVFRDDSHVYRQKLVDRDANPLLRHEVWLAIAKDCDDNLPANAPDLVSFRFPAPEHSGSLTLRASIAYRRFTPYYSDYVQTRLKTPVESPVTTVATAEAVVAPGGGATTSLDASQDARRWRDYGRALLARHNPSALEAFAKAAALAPDDPQIAIDRAAAELGTAVTGDRSDPAQRTLEVLARAFPEPMALPPRAAYWKAVALIAQGNSTAGVIELGQLVRQFPNDRQARRRLGIALAGQQRWGEARTQFEETIRIDPLDADAYLWLASIAASQHMLSDAEGYQRKYQILSRWSNPSAHGACDGNAK